MISGCLLLDQSIPHAMLHLTERERTTNVLRAEQSQREPKVDTPTSHAGRYKMNSSAHDPIKCRADQGDMISRLRRLIGVSYCVLLFGCVLRQMN